MNREITILQDIKRSFGWPVDSLRYGIPSEHRYIYEDHEENVLPGAIQDKVRFSLRKAKSAQHLLRFLTSLPWVRMIFITGSVASLNAKEDDDIDVWIVVEPKRIWVTRAIDFLTYTLAGRRRLSLDGVEAVKVKDKLCFNFYLSTETLELPSRTVSNAMQFVDAIPVFIRSLVEYKQLLQANRWIEDIFPHWYEKATNSLVFPDTIQRNERKLPLFGWIPDSIDYVAGVLMLLKSERKLVLSPSLVYRQIFTTWGTPRILSRYDQETFPESSKESQQGV